MKPTKAIKGLMVGLDAAGRTTILYKLKLGEVVSTIPTIGFNVESFDFKDTAFTFWDVGGGDKIRPLWRHYYQDANAIIFVVDSNDRDRLPEAREEFQRVLQDSALENAVFLVYANKLDLPNAISVQQVAEHLGVYTLDNNKIRVVGCCGITGDGLEEGLEWLRNNSTYSPKVNESLEEEDKGDLEDADEEILKERLDAVREVVNKLGAAGGPIVENIQKILNSKKGDVIDVDEDGQVTINKL